MGKTNITTYPRKGTETGTRMPPCTLLLNYNLSPQGDGNDMFSNAANIEKILQLIPARGRKPYCLSLLENPLKLQLIPARGRKRSLICLAPRRWNYNLSPQGDGNVTVVVFLRHIFAITTYPRKGTETVIACKVHH